MVRNLSKLEELICKRREQKVALSQISSHVCNKLPQHIQHILESLVEPFHQACLWVVWACSDGSDAQLSVQLPHEPQHEVSALVCQHLLWYSYLGVELNEGMDDFWCGDGTEWESFWIPCSLFVVTDYQDVP